MVKYRLIEFEKDEKEVIVLLNENLTPRNTKEFFAWKYLNYPGGSTTGAVALIEERIVAVVFYLPFHFFRNDEVINAARPVGGCTAKDQRGKGIFKKLMKFCLESYKKDYEFLFANPNQYSHPEFIKMGWKENNQHEYRVGLMFPWKAKTNPNLIPSKLSFESENIKITHNYFLSAGRTKFLKWRYADERYTIKKFQTGLRESYIAYRIYNKRKIRLLVLCDYIGDENYINDIIKKVCQYEKTFFIYYLKNEITDNINFIFSKFHKHVMVTYTENTPNVLQKIRFSLGDLEGTV